MCMSNEAIQSLRAYYNTSPGPQINYDSSSIKMHLSATPPLCMYTYMSVYIWPKIRVYCYLPFEAFYFRKKNLKRKTEIFLNCLYKCYIVQAYWLYLYQYF